MKRHITLFCFLAVANVGATVKEIKREKDFYNNLKNSDFAAVMLYMQDKQDPAWHTSMCKLRQQFAKTSASEFYKQAGLKFFAVDVSKCDNTHIESDFGIQAVPTFLLFRQGAVIRNKDGQPVTQEGFVGVQTLKKFVDNKLQRAMENNMREKARRQAEFWDRYPSSYFSYGFAFPGYADFCAAPSPRMYYNYPYYYGPSFGFGVTVPIR